MACATTAPRSASAAASRSAPAQRLAAPLRASFTRPSSHLAKAGKAIKVTGAQLEQEVSKRDTAVVVDFFATWCGPCLLLAQELDKAAEVLGDEVKIFKVDVDENPDVSSQLRIMGLPTLVFLPKDGSRPGVRAEGLMPAEQIVKIVQSLKEAPAASAP